MLEKAIISGVTHDTSEAKLTVFGVPDRPGVAARVFRALADSGVNIDMIVQNVSEQGLTDISFTLPKADLARRGADPRGRLQGGRRRRLQHRTPTSPRSR